MPRGTAGNRARRRKIRPICQCCLVSWRKCTPGMCCLDATIVLFCVTNDVSTHFAIPKFRSSFYPDVISMKYSAGGCLVSLMGPTHQATPRGFIRKLMIRLDIVR